MMMKGLILINCLVINLEKVNQIVFCCHFNWYIPMLITPSVADLGSWVGQCCLRDMLALINLYDQLLTKQYSVSSGC